MMEAKKSINAERSAIAKPSQGQKMTKAEFLMNRDLLREVAQIKKQGEFEKLKEFSSAAKV